MRAGAYQFPVTASVGENLASAARAVGEAAENGVELLALPECALTGYPPRDIPSSAAVDFGAVDAALDELAGLAKSKNMHILTGAITREDGLYHNSAVLLAPDGSRGVYHKRALWGWDRENFVPGGGNVSEGAGGCPGVFDLGGVRVGVRICYEVRFPEYFRELYRAKTDLDVILFYDASEKDDAERYALIKAHAATRATENVCRTLTVNTCGQYQTAPTALFGRSGRCLAELERGRRGLLWFDAAKGEPSFGERGRIEISDDLLKIEK